MKRTVGVGGPLRLVVDQEPHEQALGCRGRIWRSLRLSKLGICRIPSACGIWLAFFGDSEVKTLKDQNTDADLRLATAFGSNHLDPS